MTGSVDRVALGTGLCAGTYLMALVANVGLTAEGPNHMAPLPEELARVASDAAALRWSAALGIVGALAFTGMALGLALLTARHGRHPTAAILAIAGATTGAVWLVSFAALAASSAAAEVGLGEDAIMGLALLHTTTFLVAYAPAGLVVLAGTRGTAFGRVGRILGTAVGLSAIYSAFLVIPVEGEQSAFGLPLVLAFWGIPLWGIGVGFRVLRPLGEPQPTSGPTPSAPSMTEPPNANTLGHDQAAGPVSEPSTMLPLRS